MNKVFKKIEKQYLASKNEKFICNGRIFKTFGECENHAKDLGMRITNTETLMKNPYGLYLITIGK